MTPFQVSRDPNQWQEDLHEETIRHALGMASPPEVRRHHFPLSAKIIASSSTYPWLQVGEVVRYARVKRTPSVCPIEIFALNRQGNKVYCAVDGSVAQLLRPIEDA